MGKLHAQNAGVALSVAGSSHLRDGKGCDDACTLQKSKGAYHAVLSDGAGSARRSSSGARLAVQAASEWLEKNPITAADGAPEKHLRSCFSAVHRRLARVARARGHRLEEYAATLIVAVVRPGLAVAMHVGDGALVLHDQSDGYRTLCREDKPGPANVTDFITDRDHLQRSRFSRLEGRFDALVGVTDGLEPLAFTPDRRPFDRFFTPLVERVRREGSGPAQRSLEAFLTSDRVRTASDDDLSLVIALLEADQ